MMFHDVRPFRLLTGIVLLVCTGCTTSTTPVSLRGETATDPEQLRQVRSTLLLTAEPEQAIGVTDLRQQLEQAGQEAEITVVGRISTKQMGGGPAQADFPWDAGQAAFVLSDAAANDEHVHEHAEGEECPFCSAKAAESQALVQFLGDDGKPIPIDARELFSLTGEELVVLRGRAALTAGILTINADGLYIRK